IAPMSVVLSSAAGALGTRRALGRTGTVNVHCTILARLAEGLGGQRLAAAGYSPLTPLMELAVSRHLLSGATAGVVRSDRPHRSMVESLASSLRRLRQHDLSEADRQTLAQRGHLPAVLVALLNEYEALMRSQRLYDNRDLLDAAAAAVTAGVSLGDVGPVLVHAPLTVSPAAGRLLNTLDSRVGVTVSVLEGGPPEAAEAIHRLELALGHTAEPASAPETPANGASLHLTTAPSAVEEVRIAVRRVLADCEAGVPLYRMAILHKQQRIYSGPLADILAAADIPATVIGGRPLTESYAGRGLLGLLRLRSTDFSRVAVVTWLASFPRHHRGVPDSPVWDKLSRDAGVVQGVDEWRERFTQLAEGCRADADREDDTRSDASRDWLRHKAQQAEEIAARITELDAATTPPAECTWAALGPWAGKLLNDHVVDDHWAASEAEASQTIGELLGALGQADAVNAHPTVEVLLDTVEGLLEGRRQPQGRLGTGVVVGDVDAAVGMTFDRVHILGMTESAFPTQPTADPFLPVAGGTLLDDRQERIGAEALAFATVCAGVAPTGQVQLSTAVWDEGDRPVYPSRWFVAVANDLAGQRLTSAHVRTHAGTEWIEALPSPLAGLREASVPLNLAERRMRLAADDWAAGRHLLASPLATRPDLPLHRALAIRQARWSADLTGADGNVADLSLDPDLPALMTPIDLSRLQSATGLQGWATCGFKYYLERVLGVEATEYPEDDERWTLSALNKGSLVHLVLERFLGELVSGGRPRSDEAYTPADHDRLYAIADDCLDEAQRKGLTGHPLVWSTTRATILADLDTFLYRDAEIRRSEGWTPLAVEQRFGYPDAATSWPAMTVDVPGAASLNLRGQIDRVDVKPSATRPTVARVLDYKTGSASTTASDLEEDPVRAGTAIQLALYARAVRAQYPQLTSIEAAYWYISTKGKFTVALVDINDRVEERLLKVLRLSSTGIERGSFPQTPGDETYRPGRSSWENCLFCPFDSVCPSGRDALSERKADAPAARLHGDLTLAEDPPE
ncbi:MAG: PD-(D/E)XK nuclease family protein, partial [Candidatus Dormibacteraeota bacterium]|nr:PD-(D/E)XK nuclease family protein [Candidatus Dormibacteraeota bacterium]